MKNTNRVSCHIPSPRHDEPFGIDRVGGNGGLADVVEQVVRKNLHRQHRQERDEYARAQHAEQIAEVAAAPMRTYLMMLEKTFRPSITPSSRTSNDFSKRMMSAESFAMSTAVSTLMPTSAVCSAGASLMPSPMKPTVRRRDCRATMIRCLCAGDTRAKSVVFSAASASCSAFIFSTSSPSKVLSGQPHLPANLSSHQLVVA